MEQQDVELLTELVQSLTNDVAALKTMVASQPKPTTLLDARSSLEKVANAINGLRADVDALKQQPSSPVPIDLSPQFDALSRQIRQRPEYRLSQYVQYGGYVFGLLVIILMGMSWLAFAWKSERDKYQPAYEQANWRLRYTKQANPDYYSFMEAKFKDTAIYQWISEQEEADQKRELAREAAEQAKALSRQANELEGKSFPNRTGARGKKKER
jgi:hypothetical protein